MRVILRLSTAFDSVLNRHRHLCYWLLVLFISLAVFRTLSYMHDPPSYLSDNAYGVINGRPLLRAFSNRLLAPSLVHLISQLGFSFQTSLRVFSLLMVVIHNLILYMLLLWRTDGSHERSFKYIVYFSFVFLGMQRRWFYAWDYVDLIVFTVFAWAVFERRSTPCFVVLFLIGIVNRESGLFIALYLVIDSFGLGRDRSRDRLRFSAVVANRAKLAVGLLLLVAGCAYVKFARDYLFIESFSPDVGKDLAHQVFGNHIHLLHNMKQLLVSNLNCRDVVNSMFTFGIAVYFIRNMSRFISTHIKAFVIFTFVFCSILVFGMVNETRLFVILIPFLIFFHMEFYDKRITVET